MLATLLLLEGQNRYFAIGLVDIENELKKDLDYPGRDDPRLTLRALVPKSREVVTLDVPH